MKITVIAALALAAALSACANAPRQEYRKPGATAFDRETDTAACRAQAAAARVPIFSELAILNDCMYGKGWRMVPVEPAK